MKNLLTLFFLFLTWFSFFSTTLAETVPDTLWAKSITDASSKSNFNSVATDSEGNIYVVGYISGTNKYSFGNGVTVKAYDEEGNNVVLVKYGIDGDAKWAKSVLAGPNPSVFNSVAVDGDGNIYAVGSIAGDGEYDFGHGITVNGIDDGENIVLAKYNSGGIVQWVKSVVAGSNSSVFNSVAVDGDGNIYAAGSITGFNNFDFGSGITVSGYDGVGNIVLVKYNSRGVAQWARSVVSSADESCFNSVSVDSIGNIYAAGYIRGTKSFDLGSGVTVDGSDSGENIVLVKYNSNGETQWAKSIEKSGNDSRFEGVAVDSEGDIYAAGYIKGTGGYDFGSGVTAEGPYDGNNAILVKYNSGGIAKWAKSIADSSDYSAFNSVVIDNKDDIYVAGVINKGKPFDFGDGVEIHGDYTGRNNSGENIVLVKYNSDGDAKWAKSTAISIDSSRFQSVAVDSANNIYTVGSICGVKPFDFGNEIIVNGSFEDENYPGTQIWDPITYDAKGGNVVLVKYESDGSGFWKKYWQEIVGGAAVTAAVIGVGFGVKALYSWYTGDPEAVSKLAGDATKTLSKELSDEYSYYTGSTT